MLLGERENPIIVDVEKSTGPGEDTGLV